MTKAFWLWLLATTPSCLTGYKVRTTGLVCTIDYVKDRVKLSHKSHHISMDRLKTMGGVSPELMEQAKAAMLEENADYSEAQEPSKRSGAGYPSMGGFIEQHFNLKK